MPLAGILFAIFSHQIRRKSPYYVSFHGWSSFHGEDDAKILNLRSLVNLNFSNILAKFAAIVYYRTV